MKTSRIPLVAATGLLLSLSGCWNGEGLAREAGTWDDSLGVEASSEGNSSFVEREFWLALAEEPQWHLDTARQLFQADKPREASIELAKVAAILNFESRHVHSSREEGLLFASVQELREVSRQLRVQHDALGGPVSEVELDRVEALALRSIAAHQVALARDALRDGDGRRTGLLIRITANAIQSSFERAGEDPGSALTDRLENARRSGRKMQWEGDGTLEGTLSTLQGLDSAVEALGNVLTGRRR